VTRLRRWEPPLRRHPALVTLGLLAVVAVTAGAVSAHALLSASSVPAAGVLADNPDLDPGTTLSGPAPDFTLTDQYGQHVSLRSFRGKVVILAFNDSQCTTICPLTTTEMVDARRLLGAAGAQVQLLGIDANPQATSVADVRAYSQAHGMMQEWHFLTGSLAQLEGVWRAYHVAVQIEQGQIDHTPALYVIDVQGGLARLYLTQMAYAAIGQEAQLLAQEAASLLPDHPRVPSGLSYDRVVSVGPGTGVSLPKAGGGSVDLGPGGSGHLLLFFATWDQEVTNLARQLEALNQYAASAGRAGLPGLAAVDEASVEPSSTALGTFLGSLSPTLDYPVAIDATGQVADGYEVGDEPWLVLTSASGQILWSDDVSTNGWLTSGALAQRVVEVLASPAPAGPVGPGSAEAALAGSPVPLAALHEQAGQLLGGGFSALSARLAALRGYPVVVNVWASWCTPCRAEFPLFAAASLRYGTQVGFLGADLADVSGNARSFLSQHPVSYPSYPATLQDLSALAMVEGAPTTVFIDPTGKVVFVHPGEYPSQGALDSDIASYALGS